MNEPQSHERRGAGCPRLGSAGIWHFIVLVVFVAIAITDIREQRIEEPILIALAAGGLIAYGLIGWIGWWAVNRAQPQLGPVVLFVLYAVAMSVFFLVATIIYLMIAHAYRAGQFRGLHWPF